MIFKSFLLQESNGLISRNLPKKPILFSDSKVASALTDEGTINTKLALNDLDALFGSPSDEKVCF